MTLDDVPLVEPRAWTSTSSTRARVGRRAPPPRRARQRRHARGRAKAREFGAEGIGLCRTEHMFMAEDRQPKMRAMIMADDEEDAARGARRAAPAPAGGLRGPVRGDGGPAGDDPAARPAAARVPPEPAGAVAREVERARIERSDDLEELERTLERVHALQETNPMLGTRGVPARDPPPRDLRDAGARRSCARPRRCASAPARRRTSRS